MLWLFVVACNDDENRTTNKLTSQEQAEMVASSIGKSGFAASADQSADYTDDAVGARMAQCGYAAENSVSLSGAFGEILYSFAYDYDVALVCNGSEQPTKFTSDFTYSGSLDGPKFASDYSGSGSLIITSLDAASAVYTINGSYDRAGSFESKIEEQTSGSSNISLDIDEVLINKSTKVIVGGSADASVSGVIPSKGNYAFDAHVVFNGDGTANIQVNGKVFVANLATGQVTAKIQS